MQKIGRKNLFILFVLTLALFSISESTTRTVAATEAEEFYEKGRKAFQEYNANGFTEALANYNKAIAADPNFAPAYAGLAETYSSMGDNKRRSKEYYEDFLNAAYENMLKALKLDKDNTQVQRALALNYLHLNWKQEAAIAARSVITKDPKDAEAHYILWAATGKKLPNPDVRIALDLNPELVMAHYDLGEVYFHQKRNYNQAIDHYQKAIDISNSPLAYNYLGTVLRTQGKAGPAISAYKKAIELDPSFSTAYMNLGVALFYSNRVQESIEQQRKAISLNTNQPDAYFFLAQGYEKTNQHQEAINNYRNFLRLASDQQAYSGYVSTAKASLAKLNGK